MATDPPVDRRPTFFRPETFERHEGAARYVEGLTRTRAPRRGNARSPGLMPGAWGLLASGDSITAASGTTLGTGTVNFCDRDGTDSGESTTAYNAGPAISGPAVVAMEWTDGDWSACGCGGVPHGNHCGRQCNLCGSTRYYSPGTVTDDNGTWAFGDIPSGAWNFSRFDPVGEAQCSAWDVYGGPPSTLLYNTGLLTKSSGPLFRPGSPCHTTGPYQYAIAAWCNGDGTITVGLIVPFSENCGLSPDCVLVYNNTWCLWAAPWWTKTATVTCSDTGATITATFDPVVASGCVSLPPPTTGVSISLPIETLRERVCCSPCSILKNDLHLTLNGGSPTTLAWNPGASNWSDGTHTLACTSGSNALTGGGTWTLSPRGGCDPLHLVFASGADTAYVDE